jgi:hypothetical protein
VGNATNHFVIPFLVWLAFGLNPRVSCAGEFDYASIGLSCTFAVTHLYRESWVFDADPPAPESTEVSLATRYHQFAEERAARLNPFSLEYKRLREVRVVVREGWGGEVNGSVRFDPLGGPHTLNIFIPERYRGTLLEYLVRVHETEHLISGWDQGEAMREAVRTHDFRRFHEVQRRRIAIERVTIRKEWELLRRVSPADRTKLRHQLENDKELSRDARETFLDALEGSTKDFETFYQGQARLRLYDSHSITHHLERVVRDPRNEKEFFNSYRELPAASREALKRRIAHDSLLEEGDKFTLETLLESWDERLHYRPTQKELAQAAAEQQKEILMERLRDYLKASGQGLPPDLPHLDDFFQLFGPVSGADIVTLTRFPTHLPTPFIQYGIADLLHIHHPAVPRVAVSRELVGKHEPEIIATFQNLGYRTSRQSEQIVFVLDPQKLVPWKARF